MTTPKARQPGYFANLRTVATELIIYVRNPVLLETNRPITLQALAHIGTLLTLEFLLLIPIGIVMLFYKDAAEEFSGVDIGGPDWGNNFWQAFVALGIIAPLIEEMMFRGWLRAKPATLMIAMSILGWTLTLLALADMGSLGEDRALKISLASMLWLAMGIYFVNTVIDDNHTPLFFRRHFSWLFWGSSAAFAIIHVVNYNIDTWWLAVPMTAPQFAAGLILGFVRMTYGLRASIGMHAAFNVILVVTLFSLSGMET